MCHTLYGPFGAFLLLMALNMGGICADLCDNYLFGVVLNRYFSYICRNYMHMKHLLYLVALVVATAFVACGEVEVTPDTPENPVEEPQPEPQPDPIPEPQPYPEGTYNFDGGLVAKLYTTETNGLRNDYLSFYDYQTDNTLYIDFYCESGNSYLASGTYTLGDGSSMTCAQQYSYLLFSGSEDLHRFDEGEAMVAVNPEHESGYAWYHITARFVLPNGESVTLNYEGQPGVM